jgi:hypothetical protein
MKCQANNYGVRTALGPRVYIEAMKAPPKLELNPEQRKIAVELGRIGGQARAKALSSKERKAIATKASKAAAKARKRKAKERRAQNV